MKKIIKISFAISFIVILITSCSTRKNRFLNRGFHATTTKYNVLYNGKVAYDAQKKQLDDQYKDDFWNVLPIEPLKIEDKLALPMGPKSEPNSDSKATGGFAKAEEKAVKAVQKHSMSIGGKERNKQIDDAYFLLGKSRYYDQRFVPALETFKFIIQQYPKSSLFNAARIWEAKSLIRLGIEDQAIYNLKLLLELKEISDPIKADALTAMAMAYTKQDSTQQVINLLDSTLLYKTKNHNQKARNLFILGQLYRQQNKIDSSNIAFERLTNFKKAPYRFKIHAELERAKNYNAKTDDTELVLKSLKKLAKNRDNRPFLDAIYYQTGKIHLTNNNTEEALLFFEKTLRTKKASENQKSLAYEKIGDILFDKASFLKAGSYYDSVLNVADNKNSKRIRRLSRKRKSLDDIILLEGLASRNDSILKLTSLSKIEQEKYFKAHIKKLKKQAKEAAILAQNQKNTDFGSSLFNNTSKQSVNNNTFYFYNAQTVGFGKAEFQKIWGNRELADNWRTSVTKSSNNPKDEEEIPTTNSNITSSDSKIYDLTYYISSIPTDKKTIDSISKNRNEAYYNLGLIYKEKFKKYELATSKLESLLSFSPNEKMKLPSYYHLYKAFSHYNLPKSEYYKNKITKEYPESRYSKIIKNPKLIIKDNEENSPNASYKKTYANYLEKKYSIVLEECNLAIIKYQNTAIIPKFELLKAYTKAHTTNKETFIEALQFVVTNYPNTTEGKHALEVINSLNGVTKKQEVVNKKVPLNKKALQEKKTATKKESQSLPSNKDMLELIKKKKQNTGLPGSKK